MRLRPARYRSVEAIVPVVAGGTFCWLPRRGNHRHVSLPVKHHLAAGVTDRCAGQAPCGFVTLVQRLKIADIGCAATVLYALRRSRSFSAVRRQDAPVPCSDASSPVKYRSGDAYRHSLTAFLVQTDDHTHHASVITDVVDILPFR